MNTHEVVSIGLNAQLKTVIRIRLANGEIIDADTNQVSFAHLAAKGVRVYNEPSRTPRNRKA
jgi:hypothetical protein